MVGHATAECESLEWLPHRTGANIPKSSEEQEVGMVGLRMQDIAGGVGCECGE